MALAMPKRRTLLERLLLARRNRRLIRAAKEIGLPATMCTFCGADELRVIGLGRPQAELWGCAYCGDTQERMVRTDVRIVPTIR